LEPLIAVVGATATGKTGVGIALARALDGEIVGADSRQVYRGMAIGTAQPTADELAAAPHHLVGVVAPDEPFGLAEYLDRARAAIAAIHGRGRLPILVGGTGQYVWALLEGWTVPRVAPDAALRSELARFVAEGGADALHERLRAVDPVAAAAIHPNNVRRVIRALEVFQHSGRPISAQQRRVALDHVAVIGMELERDALYRRIDERVVEMYRRGLLDEVRALERAGYDPHLPSMASIGYPEAWAVLRGDLTVGEAIARTQTATHRLARQQSTWFRRDDTRIAWLDAADAAAEQAVALAPARLAALGTKD
jgi:tRNA dimethylallyltransferase